MGIPVMLESTVVKRSKKIIIGAAGIVLIGLVVVGFVIYKTNDAFSGDHPRYETVLPSGKTIGELNGWQRVSPPESDPVYAYLDTIEGISISVSEQPLPESFKAATADKVAELAKQYSATTTLEAGETKIYIGTSAKGPQSVIFTKKGLLILIKSQEKVSDKAWTTYVQSLT